MKKQFLRLNFTGLLIFLTFQLSAQVVISTDTIPADNSAMLEVRSAAKGLLVPRLTQEQIQAVVNPANGLLVFCLTDKKFYTYDGAENVWTDLIYGLDSIIYTPCPGVPVVSYNGRDYTTVQIGTQCWLRENLDVGTRIDGSASQSDNGIVEKYCYNNLESNCDVFGGLYQWAEIVQYLNGATNTTSWNPVPTGNVQGICPGGWHLPADVDWTTLINFLGGTNVAGGKMKEAGFSHWNSPNTGASNSSGFTALPGGYRQVSGTYEWLAGITLIAYAKEASAVNPKTIYIDWNYANINPTTGYEKTKGVSVRCLKN